jgi:hypothetical protein
MALSTATIKNALASAYGTTAVQAALYTTVPSGSAGTEVTGGSYTRKTLTWGSAVGGVVTATAVFDVPAGVTVRGAGVHNTGGTYLDGGSVPEQPFASAGQYTLTLTTTVS